MLNIVDNNPRCFELYGLSASVPDQNYSAVGLRLMDEMWRLLRSENVRNRGINHWVYPDKERLFVGVELWPDASRPDGFEHMHFTLNRYLEHLHVGAYQELPSVWKSLMAQLQVDGVVISGPSVEMYGHQSPDPKAVPETTIFIGLKTK